MARDIERAERAIFEFLEALGFDPKNDAELQQTPARVVEAFDEQLLRGYAVDLDALFATSALPVEAASGTAASRPGEWIVLQNLNVATVCPHHLMPAVGVATVGYAAGAHLFGLGTIASVVDALSRRLTLQEKIGQGVVDTLVTRAGAEAAYCEITLSHSCLSARTPGRELTKATTVATAGNFTQERAISLALALGRNPSLVR